MTTERKYRIVYLYNAMKVPHEFTTNRLVEAEKRLEFLNSDVAKEMLGIKVLTHDWIDEEVNDAWVVDWLSNWLVANLGAMAIFIGNGTMTWVMYALLMNMDRKIGMANFDYTFESNQECREFVISNIDNLNFGSHEVIYVGCKQKGKVND